jgi:DNA mismatch repair protein MutL
MAVTDLTQRIHKLSTSLANQIAAGEVIERPSSVVKELLENSLDAGASEINVDIRKGGRSLISIQDNGHGIHPDDLSLALAQHATSKLMTQADLERINTLGFRGEALSSIASVSRLKLSSRVVNQNHGWLIDVTQGDAAAGKSGSQQTPVGMTVGTHVEVRDLFFNTPARRKFLRTDNTEFFHVREIVRRVALSRHDVSFHLKHNNKTILQCSGKQKNFAERAQRIFGNKFLSNSFELNYERDSLRLWGWFGHPEIARNQVDQQYFYLNGRVIRDKQVNHAIRMATQDHFYPGKHAVYVLFLEMDAAHVDVNVHPAKHEVRFRQARDVHDFIFSALKQVVQGNRYDEGKQGQGIEEQEAQYSLPQNTFSQSPLKSGMQVRVQPRTQTSTNQHWDKSSLGSNDFLLIEDRYLITQQADQTLLLDIFKCNEIVVLSKLESEFAAQGIRRRPLLVPLTMTVSTEQGDFVEANTLAFENFGLIFERFAPNSLFIREIPLLLAYADISSLIDDMMSLIKSGKSSEEIITMMSGHANDSGLMKIDNNSLGQLVSEIRGLSSSFIEKSKGDSHHYDRSAWQILDNEMLNDLLKRKV